ncbi:transmembrane protein, putative [Medicago truncatula]|uniref:Transmembrane protein, putative n=1 Tax=Medicago truncatula TaxID=3880 RepID=G7JU80_MEDTR|nr:transmembrane protein, putative [Medicago truncatula]
MSKLYKNTYKNYRKTDLSKGLELGSMHCCFYEPIFGKILVDRNDIRQLDLKWLRYQIGLVNQESALFATSIRDNILYGIKSQICSSDVHVPPQLVFITTGLTVQVRPIQLVFIFIGLTVQVGPAQLVLINTGLTVQVRSA